MHNIKEIRTDFDYFKNQLKSRNIDVDIDKIKELDETNRKYIQKKEALESEKKDISKSKDESLFKRSKEISKELETITNEQKQIKSELDKILSNIPNIPHEDVPIGDNENDNVEISKSGNIPSFDFKPKTHYERAMNEAADWLDEQGLEYPLLVQGDVPKAEFLNKFVEHGNAILLGTYSFWVSVDVRSSTL